MELTGERLSVYNAIKKFIKNYGYSPSTRELCFLTDKSVATVHYHLKKLKETEMIDYVPGHRRTITLKGNVC